MTDLDSTTEVDSPVVSARQSCPAWCTTRHGVARGEDDWLHVSEPLLVADDVFARLCMSVNPETDAEDGPYVVVGSREYSLTEATELGGSLMRLAAVGTASTRPGATERRFRDP
jgi:hypothetical protein